MSSLTLARIGIDVGGTNTDGVLIVGNEIKAQHKSKTTSDITTGIVETVTALFSKSGYPKDAIQSVNIGTTHLVNAFIQKAGINRVMTLRLAGGSTTALPPGSDWPEDVRQSMIGAEAYIADGGYEYDGREISALNHKQILWAIRRASEKNISSVAVIGVFSNVNPKQEELVKKMFNKINPAIQVTLSHSMGGLGLIPRENGTILNAASCDLFRRISDAFQKAFDRLQLPANIYLTYGDGTKSILSEEGTPLRTFHSGPANSISGAAILSGVQDAVTVDIGGTSSDVGILLRGAPVKENSSFLMTGVGVPCNFELPRLNSFGLGGGSIITIKDGEILIGPHSLEHRFYEKAISFGGDTLTPTDIAILLGRLNIGTCSKKETKEKIATLFPDKEVESTILEIDRRLHINLVEGIKSTIASIEKIPSTLALVGGGALLFDVEILRKLLSKEFSSITIVKSGEVANAVGAANSLIGAKFVQVYDYAKTPRKQAHATAKEKAKQIAVANGALYSTLRCTQKQEVQINYLGGEPYELTITVAGDEAPVREKKKINVVSTEEDKELTNFLLTHLEPLLPIVTHRSNINSLSGLNPIEIGDIARGAGILGSGGGGSPELGHKLALNCLNQNKVLKKIDVEKLDDNDFVVAFGVMGSPVVVDERPPAITEGVEAVREIEKRLGEKCSALVVMEGGGMNCTYPLFVAAALGIPIVDGDCMGRAFPGIHMVTPNIYGEFQSHVAAISNGRQHAFIDEKDFASMESNARRQTVELGGIVSLAYMPMKGVEAKKLIIKGTLSLAEKIGKAIRESEGQLFSNRIKAMNLVLHDSSYKEARHIFQGTISKLVSSGKTMPGFNLGGFLIEDPISKEKLWIGYQNENVIAFNPSTKKIMAQVPELITIVDPNNMQPISCGEYRFGQSVAVLILSAPAQMATPKALEIVGPSAYPLEKIMELLV